MHVSTSLLMMIMKLILKIKQLLSKLKQEIINWKLWCDTAINFDTARDISWAHTLARNFDSVLKCKIKGHLPAVVDYHKGSNLGQYSFVIIVKPLKKHQRHISKIYIKTYLKKWRQRF